MTHDAMHDDHLLLRRLHGELTPDQEARLDARLAAEPALGRRLAELQRAWNRLEAPPDRTLPADFATSVRALARQESGSWRWSTAPAWARAGMATALAVGMTLGLGVGRLAPAAAGEPSALAAGPTVDIEGAWGPLDEGSLAEDFWIALDALEHAPTEAAP